MNVLFGTALAHRFVAAAVIATLASGAAVGAFASQDKLPGQSHHSALQSVISPTATATATATASATDTATPESTKTPRGEGTPRAIKGIPTGNPQHHPADNDGICDKGETAVKTTPSGVQVNVPCQATQDHGKSEDARTRTADKTPEAAETPEANETPEASETPEAGATPGAHDNRGHGHGDTHGAPVP